MRVPSLTPLLVLSASLLTTFADAQEPAAASCGSATRVSTVYLTVSADTFLAGPRLPVRVSYPFESDLSAALDATGLWVLTLPDPVRVDSVRALPRLAGFRAELTAPVFAEHRGGACAARVGYRLSKVWRVEINSKPESLKVEERVPSSTAAQMRYTRFESQEMRWTDRLSIRVFLENDQSFEETFDRQTIPSPLTAHQIADRVCKQKKCQNTWARALRGKLVDVSVEQLSIRLLPP